MDHDEMMRFASPCGIYCLACPRYKDQHSCRGCRADGRHTRCQIYDCCVTMGGKEFCFECDCFPCERLTGFAAFHPGKLFAHYRHVAIDNLVSIRDRGLSEWIGEMNRAVMSGEYAIQVKNGSGHIDQSPCPCVKLSLSGKEDREVNNS